MSHRLRFELWGEGNLLVGEVVFKVSCWLELL